MNQFLKSECPNITPEYASITAADGISYGAKDGIGSSALRLPQSSCKDEIRPIAERDGFYRSTR